MVGILRTKKILGIFFLVFHLTAMIGQDMQKGFTFLETGKYPAAVAFFENLLQTYPNHTTAQLCYARALGLSGNPTKALELFAELQQKHPDNFEVKLNYAEALLWNKQFETAAPYYQNLIAIDTANFAAILGYANALSNLKKYNKALEVVNKALKIQPKNPNALQSRKYTRLGYADQLIANKAFEKALTLLDKNRIDFPKDRDTQLLKAQLFLITKDWDRAAKVYTEMATNPRDSIVALNGLSLLAHKQHREKKALESANIAVNKLVAHQDDPALYLDTMERYVQALLWNRKFPLAQETLKTLGQKCTNEPRVMALQASYGMYTQNIKMSLAQYRALLAKNKNSFDGNLGMASAYRALGNDPKAFEYAFQTLHYFPQQADALGLLKMLKKAHTPVVEQKTAFSTDNGHNEALHLSLGTQIPLSTQFRTDIAYTYRNTQNTLSKQQATSSELGMGFHYRRNHRLAIATQVGAVRTNAPTTTYLQWTGKIQLKTQPTKLQNLDFGYQRELQNFNALLMDQEIVMNHYTAQYHLGTLFNLGWYTQYVFTTQTDNNRRNLLFTSLYYILLKQPTLKFGVNYQYIAFTTQIPGLYFSPNRFHRSELFANLQNPQNKPWFYEFNSAIGYQYIDSDPKSATFSIRGKLGYQISERFRTAIYGQYSNIASTIATGFRFTEIGFLLRWQLLSKPIFDHKIVALKKSAE